MKVEIRCASCILHRGYMEIQKATNDPFLQFKAMSSLLHFLTEEFRSTANPAYLGTKRDRLVRRVTGIPDPYAQSKHISNQKALEVLPLARKLVSNEASTELRFRKACLCSIVGNIIEFDIPDNPFKFTDLRKLIQEAEEDLAIDEISQIFKEAKEAKNILYLADNAGEIAFDTLLVQELKKMGPHIVVAVKGGPVLNDATLKDAEYVGMHIVADEITTTGTDTVGFVSNECSKEFLSVYNSADFVVAKGMGYAETLTELQLEAPHALLLRTKCSPVANFFGVSTGKNVAKLML
ncbi:MAG: ARMT1-like domain-containing protein [Candidatus Bathyarchaeota archaeon]|nr:ARMT1-like domain-containing protein [Candidatus Bathyarchaeota archaeon]